MKIIIFLLSFAPFLAFSQNPFDLIGKPKAEIQTIIGKPVATDYSKITDGKKVEQIAYQYGDYKIGFVNDTARSFAYKPTKETVSISDNRLSLYPSANLTKADRQTDPTRVLYCATIENRKLFVEVNPSNRVMKISYLP